mgnify:FL=1
MGSTQRLLCGLLVFALVASVSGCGEAEVPSTATLEVASDLGVRNARMPIEGLLTSGQVTEEQFDALVEGGYRHFISLRPESEDGAGWEEAYAQPGTFTRLPIAGAGDLTRENVEALDQLLDEVGDDPAVLYCGSSNRVGALLALRAYWMDGVPAEEAAELGRAAGMTRLEAPVLELLGLTEPSGR